MNYKQHLTILSILFTVSSCSLLHSSGKVAPPSFLPPNYNISKASISDPNNYLINRPSYTESYNNQKEEPNWVSWDLSSSNLGSVSRQNDFRSDEGLPPYFIKVSPKDYDHSGYDKGHVLPSDERTDTIKSNQSTFLMTNILPQTPNLNRGTWKNLENYCLTQVKQGHTLHIIAGGIGSKGTLPHGKVNIPASFWKVIYENGAPLIVVNIPNDSKVDADWTKYKTTIGELQKATGYQFP